MSQPIPSWPNPILALAFDMDGLMVNTEELYTIVGETILSRRGRKFTHQLKNSMMGLPGPKAIEVMIREERLDDTVTELLQESNEVFSGLLSDRLDVMPGLVQLMEELDRRGLPRCVATSSSRQFAQEVLGLIGMLERVEFVITAEDVENGKPAPDIYLAAAERLKVPSHQMLVLEDSHHGSRAGVAAGACTVAVPGPHSHDHDFQGVHFRANTLEDPAIMALLTI